MNGTGSTLDVDLDTRVADLLDAFGGVVQSGFDPAKMRAFNDKGQALVDGIARLNRGRLPAVPFKGPHGWTPEQTAAFVTMAVGASLL